MYVCEVCVCMYVCALCVCICVCVCVKCVCMYVCVKCMYVCVCVCVKEEGLCTTASTQLLSPCNFFWSYHHGIFQQIS